MYALKKCNLKIVDYSLLYCRYKYIDGITIYKYIDGITDITDIVDVIDATDIVNNLDFIDITDILTDIIFKIL